VERIVREAAPGRTIRVVSSPISRWRGCLERWNDCDGADALRVLCKPARGLRWGHNRFVSGTVRRHPKA